MNDQVDFQALFQISTMFLASHGGNDTLGIHFSDSTIDPIGEIQIPLLIKNHTGRTIDLGLLRRSAIASKTRNPGACHPVDNPPRIDFTN